MLMGGNSIQLMNKDSAKNGNRQNKISNIKDCFNESVQMQGQEKNSRRLDGGGTS